MSSATLPWMMRSRSASGPPDGGDAALRDDA